MHCHTTVLPPVLWRHQDEYRTSTPLAKTPQHKQCSAALKATACAAKPTLYPHCAEAHATATHNCVGLIANIHWWLVSLTQMSTPFQSTPQHKLGSLTN